MDMWLHRLSQNSELHSILNIPNNYAIESAELAEIPKHKLESIRIISVVNNLTELDLLILKITESEIKNIVVVTNQNILSEIKKSLSYLDVQFEILCFVEDASTFADNYDHVKFFTNNPDLPNESNNLYFWPDLRYSREHFRQVNGPKKFGPAIVPITVPNPDGCLSTNFNSLGKCIFVKENTTTEPVLSIIIPHYDNFINLTAMLQNLAIEIQKAKLNIQVIIVDDGSPLFDSTMLQENIAIDNFAILRMNRNKLREMGDCSYRAGAARNLGSMWAESETLLFIDCDILVNVELLHEVLNSIKDADLIMPQRSQLKKDIKKIYSDILEEDIDQDMTPYWKNFYNSASTWNSNEARWKFVSTFCLALKKKTFLELGGFSSSFVSYGCEDVELGFRLHKHNAIFKNISTKVFHLQPNQDRSEYCFNYERRRAMLFRSYYYLFQLHQSPEIFSELIQANKYLVQV